MARARNWVGTLNVGLKDGITVEEGEKELKDVFGQLKPERMSDSILWFVAQLERGKENQKLHIQFAVVFKAARVSSRSNFQNIAKACGMRGLNPHLEVMRGTPAASQKYCTKEEDREKETNPIEFGVIPPGACRSDLIELVRRVTTGELAWDDVDMEEPFLASRHHALLRRLYTKEMQKVYRSTKPKCIWRWGPPGAGKSYAAFHEDSKPEWLTDGRSYLKSHNGGGSKWWDGFDPMKCKTLILNEFRGGIEFSLLMQIADEHPMRVSVRGEEDRPLKFDTLSVNSVMHPRDVYRGVFEGEGGDEPFAQLERRFKIIKMEPRTGLQLAFL